MSTKILVGNLPAGTSAEDVRHDWASVGAPPLAVDQVEGGNPDKLTFVVELDIDHKTAMIMAVRRRDRFFKGRRITIYVPALME